MNVAPEARATPVETQAARPAGTVVYVLGFVPTYVDQELRALRARGVSVRTVLPAPWPRAALWDTITGADHGATARGVPDFHAWLSRPATSLAAPALRVLARARTPRARVAQALVSALRAGTVRPLLAAAMLAEHLHGQSVARVHSHFATDPAAVGAELADLLGVPFGLTTHAHDIFAPRDPTRLRRLLARADRVIAISEFNRAHLGRVGGPALAEKVRVLHLGVDVRALPRWAPTAEPFTIACTASGLGEKKGVAVLLEACRMLAARGLRFACEICGSDPTGERLTALRREVADRGLGSFVRLPGSLPWQEAQARVARAGVFVHPSVVAADGDMDGIPFSLIEAMGIGAPVISTRVSGIPELVEDGRSGVLVSPGDGAALATAIERLARHPERARELGARARLRVREAFDLDRSVDGLLSVWGEGAASGVCA